MFLAILEVTPPTSQHFRNALSRTCNASRLLLHLCGVTPGNPWDSVRDLSRFSFCDFQKHIMFLAVLEVTPPTSQHFRKAFSRICNASWLLLHFCGVTPGNPRDSVRDLSRFSCDWILRFSKTHHAFVTPPTSQHFRNAISRFCNASRLLLHFWVGNPG